MIKYTTIIAAICGLFSFAGNTNQKNLMTGQTVADSIELILIEVESGTSNFEALLLTNHLYYLKHMSTDYDNYGKGFWQSIDTLKNDNWEIIRLRQGGCQNSSGTSQIGNCIERQEHTINKDLNKVIKFTGNGSGYFTTINYLYDEKGSLIEYRDFDKVFNLNYDDKNKLMEVIKSKVNHGVSKMTRKIRFKKLLTTKDKN